MSEPAVPPVTQFVETHALWRVLQRQDDEAEQLVGRLSEAEKREFRACLRFLLRLAER